MVKKNLTLVFFLLSYFGSQAQLLEFKQIERLPGTVNTKSEEGMPLLSHDGKKLFFTRSLYRENEGGIYAGQDIWFSEFGNTGWRRASNSISSFNNKNNNVMSGISRDGNTFYFVNASPYHKMEGIYFSKKTGENWSRPQLITLPGIDNYDFISFYVSPDLDVIFLSMKADDSRGNEDLYFSVKDGAGLWTKPKNLGATINTNGFEISPFLSADKKRLYFASNGHKGEGDADIFYSDRLYDSWETWSVPVNLGSQINSKKFDAFFSIYGDTIAYFASNRDDKYADIYKAKVMQGKSILGEGQTYLTSNEWNDLIGKNVSAEFVFPHRASMLTAAQQELIFYIVNKLMLQKDIRFHLVVKEQEDAVFSKERITAISNELKKSGIDASRINVEQIFEIENTQRGVVTIRLFK